jgi:hypothetical protein
VATDALALQTATPIRNVVFPPSVYALVPSAIPAAAWTSFNGPNLGLRVDVQVKNTGNAPITGRVEITRARLGNADAKYLDNSRMAPLVLSSTGVPLAGTVPLAGGMLFKRSEIGVPAGSTANLVVSFRWWETSAQGALQRTGSLSLRVRLPR